MNGGNVPASDYSHRWARPPIIANTFASMKSGPRPLHGPSTSQLPACWALARAARDRIDGMGPQFARRCPRCSTRREARLPWSAERWGGSQSNDRRPASIRAARSRAARPIAGRSRVLQRIGPDRSPCRRELLLPIRSARSGRHRPARSPAGAGSHNEVRSGPIRPMRSRRPGSPVGGLRGHVRTPPRRYALEKTTLPRPALMAR